MKTKLLSCLAIAVLLSFFSCGDDAAAYESGAANDDYIDGSGNVNIPNGGVVYLNQDINDLNLNDDDSHAYLLDALEVEGNINLTHGNVYVDTQYSKSNLFVDGDANIHDSLVVNRGVFIIDGNLNLNPGGVIVLTDSSSLIIRGDFNHHGIVVGFDNTTYQDTFNDHGVEIDKPSSYNPFL